MQIRIDHRLDLPVDTLVQELLAKPRENQKPSPPYEADDLHALVWLPHSHILDVAETETIPDRLLVRIAPSLKSRVRHRQNMWSSPQTSGGTRCNTYKAGGQKVGLLLYDPQAASWNPAAAIVSAGIVSSHHFGVPANWTNEQALAFVGTFTEPMRLARQLTLLRFDSVERFLP